MGKAKRWVKSLLGVGRNERSNGGEGVGEKKRISFGVSNRELSAGELRISYVDCEKEQNKHAIAVAAATAAAADAAIAAAQAAVEVVRLTSGGRIIRKEWWAAVRIQSAFRGLLAKKALRALKSVVKLQALVRGHLVRKRLFLYLNTTKLLLRDRSVVRKTRYSHLLTFCENSRFHHEVKHRRSLERFDGNCSEHSCTFRGKRLSTSSTTSIGSPRIIEVDIGRSMPKKCEDHLYCLPYPTLARIKIPNHSNFQESTSFLSGEDYQFSISTAQSTRRFHNSSESVTGPIMITPRKFMSSQPDSPNYMANTLSSNAKTRAQSAPKQRPELKRMAKCSSIGMRKSCSQAH